MNVQTLQIEQLANEEPREKPASPQVVEILDASPYAEFVGILDFLGRSKHKSSETSGGNKGQN